MVSSYISIRSDWRKMGASQSSPRALRSESCASCTPGRTRERSRSSTRIRNRAPAERANSQASRAVRRLPRWSWPVGLGAKRPSETFISLLSRLVRAPGRRGLWDPDSGRRFGGERGEDDVPDAQAPELTGDDGGVGHNATRHDAGYEGGGPGPLRDSGQGASRHGQGEGPWGYALALTDAGEVGEDLRAMDVFFVHGGAQGVDVAHRDDQGGGVRDGRLMIGGAFDRAPPRPIGLHQDHVGQPGEIAYPPGVDAPHPVLGEHPRSHDHR